MINKAIAELNNYIILETYEEKKQSNAYQSEADLEKELIEDLKAQGYEYKKNITDNDSLLENAKKQIEELNNVEFKKEEWERFLKKYLNNPNEGMIEKTRKIHDNSAYDFVFDDGSIKNINILDKNNIINNKLQVINQFKNEGKYKNRYDVTILVNGLPLVQIELKRRGVAIKEAFNQVHRYSKESFNENNSLYQYLQIFVISNGTDTRYFANTTAINKNSSFDFTINWAKANNEHIKDLKDFSATFLQKNTLLNILIKYCVFNVENTLLIMRPYQIAATERILNKIQSLNQANGNSKSGGYIWHTTGSGKTLTSFQAARLATKFDFIHKVFFVVDRQDLDNQTIKEFQKFSKNSVIGTEDVKKLKENVNNNDNKIIVTTIQKLNILMKDEKNLDIYSKQVVFIFDECHRSQFGETQRNLKEKFKKYYQFGFTGTPIFEENAIGPQTTKSVFGDELHTYVITDAIRDEKVLKFNVDYNDIRAVFREQEKERDENKINKYETEEYLLHPNRINKITKYILDNFDKKTRRLYGNKNFNAIFAVSSIKAAKLYYEEFKKLQEGKENPLKITTIFSRKANEAQNSIGDISEEELEIPKNPNDGEFLENDGEFLEKVISDYNNMFDSSYQLSNDNKNGFYDFNKNVSEKLKNIEIDLLIVVGMFLTGFDSKALNTLFVDRNLKYHGLIQAFSRTNRIYNSTKTCGNIVTFRDLEKDVIDAITLFGDKDNKKLVLEESYDYYMYGFDKKENKETNNGYLQIVEELTNKFPLPIDIEREDRKREFVKLFGEYLKVYNILQNYDEFIALKELQNIDKTNEDEINQFKEKYCLNDDKFDEMSKINLLPERSIQDYKSTYLDIKDWLLREKDSKKQYIDLTNWDDVVFEIELITSQEINLDYILDLIFKQNKEKKDKSSIIEGIIKLIHSSIGFRTKEQLIIDFIEKIDIDKIDSKENLSEKFSNFVQIKKQQEAIELIDIINNIADIHEARAKSYINRSLKYGYASDDGTDLSEIINMNRMDPKYIQKKMSVFEKISKFIEKFKDIGKMKEIVWGDDDYK